MIVMKRSHKLLNAAAGIVLAAALTVTPVFAAESYDEEEANQPSLSETLYTDSLDRIQTYHDANNDRDDDLTTAALKSMSDTNEKISSQIIGDTVDATHTGVGIARGATDRALYLGTLAKEHLDNSADRIRTLNRAGFDLTMNNLNYGASLIKGVANSALETGRYAVDSIAAATSMK